MPLLRFNTAFMKSPIAILEEGTKVLLKIETKIIR